MKNNLFCYATSELSQDAFLCWLVSFALEGAKSDVALQVCSREMLNVYDSVEKRSSLPVGSALGEHPANAITATISNATIVTKCLDFMYILRI